MSTLRSPLHFGIIPITVMGSLPHGSQVLMGTSAGHVFVSHASTDRATADRIVEEIERHGIPCWISHRDIAPGADYQRCIVAAVDEACAILLLFSTGASRSPEVPKELALASKRHKLIVPARLEDIFPTGALAYQLTNAQFVDLFNNYRLAMQRLIETIAGLRGMPKPSVVIAVPRSKRIRNGLLVMVGSVLMIGGIATTFVMRQSGTGMPQLPSKGGTAGETASRVVERGSVIAIPVPDRSARDGQVPSATQGDASPPARPSERERASPIVAERRLPEPQPPIASQDGRTPAVAGTGESDASVSAARKDADLAASVQPPVPAAKPSAPKREVSAILRELGAASGTQRAARLQSLLAGDLSELISVTSAVELLGDIPAPILRRDAIRQLLPAMKRPLDEADLMQLLQPFSGSARAVTLEVLLPCVGQPMDDAQAERVLADIPRPRRSGLSRMLQAPPPFPACPNL